MNLTCFVLSIVPGAFLISINAQETITVEAANTDISENLDLEAVASVFAETEDLEDFEKKLTDPETQISNLDLNEDGEVDYLRVVENSKDETHVQVVGDEYMYGDNYIIEPVFVHRQ